jgi:hypothetical protein
MAVFAGPEIVNDGLVLHLDAANSKSYPGSGTTWKDISASALSANLDNSINFDNGAFVYNGTPNASSSVTLNSNQFANNSYTWFAWVLGMQGGSGTAFNMPAIGYGSGSWSRLGFRYTGSVWVYSAYNSSGPPLVRNIDLGAGSSTVWIQLCAVVNTIGATITTYRNGLRFAQGESVDTTGNGSTFGVGVSGDTFSGWDTNFLGKISTVKIYNRALAAQEVQQNFEATRGRYGI